MSEPFRSKWLDALRHHESTSVGFVSGQQITDPVGTHEREEEKEEEIVDRFSTREDGRAGAKASPEALTKLTKATSPSTCFDCRATHPDTTACGGSPFYLGAVIEDAPARWMRAIHCGVCHERGTDIAVLE